jgi:hypothetical protein
MWVERFDRRSGERDAPALADNETDPD